MVTTPKLDTRAHKCFPSGGRRSRQKKKRVSVRERGTHKINCAATILSQDSGFVQITFFNDWFAVLVSAVFAARVRDSENFLPIGFSADFALSVAFSARRKARVWPGRGDAA